jgi:dethiobiotin synthetase
MIRIIVAGINTGVGKTAISAIITESLDGNYWKPVQCGFPSDMAWVQERLSSKRRCYPSSFQLQDPSSPHLAAKKEGMRIGAKNLIPPKSPRPLVIEGTGGVLTPLNELEVWADAAARWDALWILVHRHYLGSLNHFALTVESMKLRKFSLLGIIFNGIGDLETEEMLLTKAQAACLGRLGWQKTLTPMTVQRIAKEWKPHLIKALGL